MVPIRLLAQSIGLLLALAIFQGQAGEARADCVDQELADKLAFKRTRRGRVPRDFVKAQRHELSASGGYYVSDLFSGTWILSGSYSFHMLEDMAVEAGFAYTHQNADVVRAVEDGRAITLDDEYAATMFVSSLLVWYPLHGKLQLGGSVVHFDFHLDGGVGVVSAPTSRGVVGIGGMGLKFFLGDAVAFRIDVRDHVFQQELLAESYIVNDLSLTTGFSLFLPTGF